MKRRYNFILLMVLVFLLIPGGASAGQGAVKVKLLKKSEDVPSMAQKALRPEAKWVDKGNERVITLEFLPLEFMGTRGYLGEVTVAGHACRVTSYYKEYDSHNHPKNGKDRRMKGKPYPKTLEFSVSPSTSLCDLKFYVPVMGEMGFGEQEARLKIEWPDADKGGASREEKRSLPSQRAPLQKASAPMDLKDGLYAIDVSLWHETEDKPSMGNGALDHKAELFVKDGKATLFLGTKALSVSNIQASLCRVFYETDEGFSAAVPHCYDLKVEGEELPRPRIFALPLKEKTDMMKVKVDPKVAPMGDEPLNARLKLDFKSLKTINADETTLALQAKNGAKRPSFKEAHDYVDKGVVLSVPANGFDEAFEFYANALVGGDLQNQLQKLQLPLGTKAYRIEARRPIKSIPKDYKDSVQTLGKRLEPLKPVTVALPFSGSGEIYNEKGEKLKSKASGGKISFETKSLGVFFIKTQAALPKQVGKNSGFTAKPPAKAAAPVAPAAVQPSPARLASASAAAPVSSSAPEAPAPEGEDGYEGADDWDAEDIPEGDGQEDSQLADEAGDTADLHPTNNEALQEKERPGLIIFCLMIIFAALAGGLYMTRKYYLMYMDELIYEADRKKEER
ncbi:NEAT domain-containing protein [Aedoeadaptatus pacaensis]|uniref:NEAT domain-containing protein n=1 Tax=Aedoeadaptatus pacaensis TaxID=1776390 RepID=UPI000B1D9E86|nr:NEAT domain-containing protein [Peptoniphilus pacaensis]